MSKNVIYQRTLSQNSVLSIRQGALCWDYKLFIDSSAMSSTTLYPGSQFAIPTFPYSKNPSKEVGMTLLSKAMTTKHKGNAVSIIL